MVKQGLKIFLKKVFFGYEDLYYKLMMDIRNKKKYYMIGKSF